MSLSKVILCLLVACAPLSHSRHMGNEGGGGGGADEAGVDEIRTNLLAWLEAGRAHDLKFNERVDYAFLVTNLSKFLAKQFVIVSFETAAQELAETKPERKVRVDGEPKSCRGFFAQADRRPHILCVVERYPKSGAEQYRVISHEFAGLALVEQNLGAASDYWFTNQISDFGGYEKVWRLGVKLNSPAQRYTGYLKARSDQHVLGAIQLQRLTGGAVQLDFSDGRMIHTLVASASYLDPASGLNLADFSGAQNIKLMWHEQADGSWQGSVEEIGFAESSGEFVINPDSATLNELALSLAPSDRVLAAFSGTTNFSQSAVRKLVRVLVLPLREQFEDELYQALSPLRRVLIKFVYSDSLSLSFSDATWDLRNGLAMGNLMIAREGRDTTLSVDCQISTNDFTCRHFASSATLLVGTTFATASSDSSPPVDAPPLQTLTRTFYGSTNINAEKVTPATFKVFRSPLAPLDEMLDLFTPEDLRPSRLSVTVAFSDLTRVDFPSMLWDRTSGSLTGLGDLAGSPAPRLSCQKFYFMQTAQPFHCIYESPLRHVWIEMEFKP